MPLNMRCCSTSVFIIAHKDLSQQLAAYLTQKRKVKEELDHFVQRMALA